MQNRPLDYPRLGVQNKHIKLVLKKAGVFINTYLRHTDISTTHGNYLKITPSLSDGLDRGPEARVFLPQHIPTPLAIHLRLRNAPPVENLHASCLMQNFAKHLFGNVESVWPHG